MLECLPRASVWWCVCAPSFPSSLPSLHARTPSVYLCLYMSQYVSISLSFLSSLPPLLARAPCVSCVDGPYGISLWALWDESSSHVCVYVCMCVCVYVSMYVWEQSSTRTISPWTWWDQSTFNYMISECVHEPFDISLWTFWAFWDQSTLSH